MIAIVGHNFIHFVPKGVAVVGIVPVTHLVDDNVVDNAELGHHITFPVKVELAARATARSAIAGVFDGEACDFDANFCKVSTMASISALIWGWWAAGTTLTKASLAIWRKRGWGCKSLAFALSFCL